MSEFAHDGATGAELIARAKALAPRIAAAAPQIEQAMELPADVVAALHEARLFRILLPRTLGGYQIEPAVFFAIIEALARADASVAWCVGQGAGCSMAAAFLAPEAAREIFGSHCAVMASGPPSRNAKAIKCAGGYRVTGSWTLASGGRHSSWFGGHAAVIGEDGKPVIGADGKPVIRTMMFSRTATKLTPNWDVIGLRGTGSDDYAVEDLFVAETFTFTREAAQDRRDMSPLYTFSGLNMFGVAFAATSLGLARSALEDFITLASGKLLMGQARLVRESAVNQLQLGLAEAKLRSARAFLLTTLQEVGAAANARGCLTRDERVGLRLATTWAIQQGRDVVDVAYNCAGATALHKGNPIERRFRDVHAVTQHIQGGMAVFETMGQALFGMPVQSNLL